MPPLTACDGLLPLDEGPRLILYYQTHHDKSGNPISVLPLVTQHTGTTHVIVAAIHVNDGPGNITLNDDPPEDGKFDTLWREVKSLQDAGVKVMGMLGGAAQGSFIRLSGDDSSFEDYYTPLRDLIRRHCFDGLDLSIEEEITLASAQRLISRLRSDFGASFIISLAPVATALIPGLPQLSGFSYFELEAWCQSLITCATDEPPPPPIVSFYSAQTYCGWADAADPLLYATWICQGWDPSRLVLGLVTNPANGAGHVPLPRMLPILRGVRAAFPDFGGVMGWEYFNAGLERAGPRQPWEWAKEIGRVVRTRETSASLELPAGFREKAATWARRRRPAWPAKDVDRLIRRGAAPADAVQALDAAHGDADLAASFLFDAL